MSFTIEKSIWSSIFAVPTSIVDQHIKLCGGLTLKVLLLVLRQGGDLTSEEIASALSVPAPDVQDALLYWQQAGILSSTEQTPVQAPIPALTPSPSTVLAPSATVAPYRPASPPISQEEPDKALVPAAAPAEPPEPRKVQTISKARGRLTTGVINQMAQEDENIAYLLQESQSVLGRPLTPVTTDVIVSLYSYYGMQPDLILMLLQYCVTMGKDGSMRYVEKVAATWLENGVDTHERAEREILRATEISSVEHRIKTAFGIYDRKLVEKEKQFVGTWINDYGFDLEMISMAFERTVEKKGKLSFAYINGILSNWHAKGIKTPAQAEEDMQEKQPAAQARQPATSSKASYDLDEIKKMITYQSLLDE